MKNTFLIIFMVFAHLNYSVANELKDKKIKSAIYYQEWGQEQFEYRIPNEKKTNWEQALPTMQLIKKSRAFLEKEIGSETMQWWLGEVTQTFDFWNFFGEKEEVFYYYVVTFIQNSPTGGTGIPATFKVYISNDGVIDGKRVKKLTKHQLKSKEK